MEDIELCETYCPKDCIYMSHIDSGQTPICYYSVLAGECRKCKISECNKYKSGKPLKPRMNTEFVVFWEYLIYDEDADSFW